MSFSLRVRRDGPRAVKKWTYLLPEKIFGCLLATRGGVALFVYLAIAASQFVLVARCGQPAMASR